MSQLLIKTLCQAQTSACRLPSRLLTTGIAANRHANVAPEHHDLKRADLMHAQKVLHTKKYLDESLFPTNTVMNPLRDATLQTQQSVDPLKVEPLAEGPVKDASDKLMSTRDVVDKKNKANLDQLNDIADQLTRYLPHFFSRPHPFSLYSKDLVFIDRTRSLRTQGLSQYIMQLALTKVYYTLNYTSNKFEVLNLVKDPEESCLKIRWRMISKPGLLRFILTFWRYYGEEVWKDAISTLYVNKEGLIYCHECDNIDVEKVGAKVEKVVKSPLASRGINV